LSFRPTSVATRDGRRGARIVENARHMLVPNRFSILACAALAVATPLVAGALMGSRVDQGGRGLAYHLLYWPVLLLHRLPAFADVIKTSALHIVLLYFAGYVLAWFVAGNLVAAIVRRARPARSAPATPADEH
jgi:hypothetical protein